MLCEGQRELYSDSIRLIITATLKRRWLAADGRELVVYRFRTGGHGCQWPLRHCRACAKLLSTVWTGNKGEAKHSGTIPMHPFVHSYSTPLHAPWEWACSCPVGRAAAKSSSSSSLLLLDFSWKETIATYEYAHRFQNDWKFYLQGNGGKKGWKHLTDLLCTGTSHITTTRRRTFDDQQERMCVCSIDFCISLHRIERNSIKRQKELWDERAIKHAPLLSFCIK